MKIAFVSSEAVPFAKTGGLADVAGALTKELAGRGHDVILFLPGYAEIAQKNPKSQAIGSGLQVTVGTRRLPLKLEEIRQDGVRVVLLVNDELYAAPSCLAT